MKPPRYTEVGRYAYHFCCTKIEPYSQHLIQRAELSKCAGAPWLKEGATHGCWCSAWKKQEDGTFLHWRDGKWQAPRRGCIKSKPVLIL
jgi:hypothetical protein